MKRYFSVIGLIGLIICLPLVSSFTAGAQGGGAWGTIKGVVIFDPAKDIPKVKELNVTKDQQHCLAKGPIMSEDWVVNEKNRGVQDVFIWLEPKVKNAKLPVHPSLVKPKEKEVVMDQPRCKFIPHALSMHESQTLLVKNSSPIAHNFKYAGHPFFNPGANPLMPPGATYKANLKKDRLPVSVECSIHPWMRAYIRVFDHPYHTLTNENGEFSMPNAPAGNYILKVWHPASGWMGGAKGKDGMPIVIQNGGTTDLGKLKISD